MVGGSTMRYLIAIFLAFSLVLSACAPTQPETQETPEIPPTAEPEPQPEPETEPEQGDATEVDNALDDIFGPIDAEQMITIDDVSCDAENSRLTFRFRNIGDKSWQLNQDVPFPAPTDLVSMRILLNNYEMNGHRAAMKDGERLFGPEELFSDNCGGVDVLAPGESATCTVETIPLKEGTIGGGVNELVLNTAGSDGNVRFTCE